MTNDYVVFIINSNGEYNPSGVNAGGKFHDAYVKAKELAAKHCPHKNDEWCGYEIQTKSGMCVKSGRVFWSEYWGKVRDVLWPNVHNVPYHKRKPLQEV